MYYSLSSSDRAHAFLSLLHHILESKEFPLDFDDATTPHSPCFISLFHDSNSVQENIDTEDEIAFATEMKIARVDIMKDVPGYHKRDEALLARDAKLIEKDLARQAADICERYHLSFSFSHDR